MNTNTNTNTTDYQSYRSLRWTTDADECEAGCGTVLSDRNYVEGDLGHYCSRECKCESECSVPSDAEMRRAEAAQMGVC